ncbi:MAG: ABC transporter ATP-binding protein [Geminicoccaceae bacterium]|nr:ABC transporter ATP-binding protein [Geminicoccaceae bacterium]
MADALRLRVDRLDYGGEALFRDLVLDLPKGRWTALIGGSGVGKTTLLRAAAGLVPGVEGLGPAALMAQSDLLLPWLDVEANVLLGPRLRGGVTPDLRAKAADLIERVGLGDARKRLPAELSGGMRQRAALARTLLEDRPLVLMDEPFSALDAITRHRVQDLAAELLDGRTVLLVTHSPPEALRLAHRLLLLEGRPVRLRPLDVPASPTPRRADDPALLRRQGQLLEALAGEGDKGRATCAA